MKTYTGSCHCKVVTYEVTGNFTSALKCNCSHCKRKGFLLAFVPIAQFNLLSGEDNVSLYQFNTKHIDHIFCKTCGVQSYGYGQDKDGNKTTMINLNCLENFDTTAIPVHEYDGASA